MSLQCIRRQMRCLRQEGVRAWCQRHIDIHLIQPAREMTRQQVIVSAGVGFWGGLFPVPPCTMPATLFCITMYSAGVPKMQRFSLPMASVAVIINELSLPADLAMMPCFIMLGQRAYRSITGEDLAPCSEILKNIQAKPVETLCHFSTSFGLGIAVWTLTTPLVLGKIRVFGALSRLC
ncbi:unnamed protein product [Symbiodinium microadriaticum]|nr:unnamed protein product [Symbiodinium microadriaticum]CAE7933899.1 unnamed protein product [Symbiodinium sp. KB8]